jgi:hypothetical protein
MNAWVTGIIIGAAALVVVVTVIGVIYATLRDRDDA